MLYLICPCTIISAFQVDSTPELRSGLLLAFAAAVIIHIGLLLFNLLIRKPLRMSPVEQASVIYSNAGNLIIPIVSALLGQEWVVYTCAYICVQIVLQWTHCKPLISGETHLDVKKIITNVNMIAIFLGHCYLRFGNKSPEGRSGRY